MIGNGTYKVTTPPASDPVTVAEAKTHLKVDYSDDDTYISTLISVGTLYAEEYTCRAIMKQTITQVLEGFPYYSYRNTDLAIKLFRPPLNALKTVKYYDSDNTLTTFYDIAGDTSKLIVDSLREPARLYPAPGMTYPTTKSRPDAIEIIYDAGWSTASDVPAPVKQAILLIVGELYERREDFVKQLPTAAEYLLNPYRVTIF